MKSEKINYYRCDENRNSDEQQWEVRDEERESKSVKKNRDRDKERKNNYYGR
ncbi:MAG: hypothetical protein RR324_02725 [Cellulosilyticaceae bacterium]